eukprot:m.155695 g.155695  ORF g.155695 m.155695 type:complete len:636 (-) comp30950_c0_seq3:594-2501(-)
MICQFLIVATAFACVGAVPIRSLSTDELCRDTWGFRDSTFNRSCDAWYRLSCETPPEGVVDHCCASCASSEQNAKIFPWNEPQTSVKQTKYAEYRFGDIFRANEALTGNYALRTQDYQQKFPDSFATQYMLALANSSKKDRANNVAVLTNILKTSSLITSTPIPSPTTVVVHLRLGDVFNGERYPMDLIWLNGLCHSALSDTNINIDSKDCVHQNVYVYSQAYYCDMLQQLPPEIDTVVLVGSVSHWVLPRLRKASKDEVHHMVGKARSIEYVDRVAEFFTRLGYNVRQRISGVTSEIDYTPDEDMFYMTHAPWFIKGGGGFSHMLATLVTSLGGHRIEGPVKDSSRETSHLYHCNKEGPRLEGSNVSLNETKDKPDWIHAIQFGNMRTATTLQFETVCIGLALRLQSSPLLLSKLRCRFVYHGDFTTLFDPGTPLVLKTHQPPTIQRWFPNGSSSTFPQGMKSVPLFVTHSLVDQDVHSTRMTDWQNEGWNIAHTASVQEVSKKGYYGVYEYQSSLGLDDDQVEMLLEFVRYWDILRLCCGRQMSKHWRNALLHAPPARGYDVHKPSFAGCEMYNISQVEVFFLNSNVSQLLATYPLLAPMLKPATVDDKLDGTYCEQYNRDVTIKHLEFNEHN